MGRTKNKKTNIPPAIQSQNAPVVVETTPALLPESHLPDEPLLDDIPIIPALQPYLSLLPALRGVGQSTQQALHEALYTAGSTAAQALESYLKDKSLLNQLETSAEGKEATSESEELRLLLNYVSVEMAAENLKRACSGPDGKILLRDGDNKILNEVAAAALSAFAYAASRRPSTKHVEYLMNPTQSVDAHEDTGSQSSQTLSQLPSATLPGAPYQRGSNYSTGTNGSLGMGNPFGILKPRKRSTQRRIQDGNQEFSLDDDEDDLDDDVDVSDVDLDDDSEPLTDLLDESRRTESPLEDFDNTDALLRFACTVGHIEIVKSLVKIRKSPDYVCIRKSTMLAEACCCGQLEIVRELIASGADVNAQSESTHNTPLIYASTAGKLECVQELLKHPNILVDTRNTSGHSALMEASSAGHLEIVKELISKGANIYAIVENVDFKESSLSLASYRGHVEVVKCLLENMQPCQERDDELHTGLLEASMDGHVEVAKVLLDAGAPVNQPSENFESPLTLASCGGHYELVKLLLDRNADIEEPNDENYSPLQEAAREGHREVVELLLDRGANVNSKIEDSVETALTLAASGGYLSVVELLVSRGGNLLLGDRTPLYEATQEGHLEVAQYIVQQLKKNEKKEDVKADLEAALVCAAETNNLTLVNLFLENGASVDCFSKEGRSPLMEASRQGHVNLIEFLLQRGASINAKSPNEDATALSLACLFGHSEATQLLLENGANPEIPLKDSVSCVIEASRNGNTDCARIVLDHIGSKGKQKEGPTNQQQISTSTAAEISNRPKIKPVSKLNKDASTTSNTSQPTPPIFPTLNGDPSAFAQELALLGQKISPELAAAAAASLKTGSISNGVFGNPALVNTKKDEKNKKSTTTINASLNKLISQQQQANEDAKLNELLQQLPSDLVSAMLAATATTNAAQAANTTADESMLAHFLQRSLVEPKRRDAAWTNEELTAFKEMVRQKVRQLPQPANNMPNALEVQHKHQQHHDLMMANILADCCPGCTHNHSNYASNVLQGLQNADAFPSHALKRKGSASMPQRVGTITTECSGSFGARQVNSVKQKIAETTELLRSKLDGLPLTNETDETLQELRKLSMQQKASPTQNSLIQTSMYLNRLNNPNSANTTALTPEQQQQILFYQQQEIQNLQNLQAAAGHHHGSVPCHQAHHNINTPCLSQYHTSGRVARRTNQTGTNNTASKQTSTGKLVDRRGNSSLPTTPSVNDPKVSSYVDMQTEGNNDTALTVACVGGHAPLVGLLIQRGANVEHRDKKGFTPLILSATGGHVECCKLLLEAGCQVDAVSERTKDTALSLACSSGRKEVVELLLSYNANKEHRNVSDYTPLSLASSGGYVDIIHLLLDAGAEINSRTGSKLGISPLMLSAMNGHDHATLLLLERGSDINAQIETNRNTALTLACFQGRTEVVRLLLDYNANYEHRAKTGLTPLMEAANGGFTDVGALLLKSGADPNAPPVPTSRDTALTIAADKGHSAFVSMLLLEGASIDVRNKKGCTPIFLAASNGHLETVKILVTSGADVDALDNRKTSPLVAAFRKGFVKVVEFLVQHVNQFPNDQECQRFCNTVTDADLAIKVNKCLKLIIEQKSKQAEQANNAAKMLLDELAEEEAREESKKLSRKRLKEKKKAKKLAKKQAEFEEAAANTVEEESPEPTPEESVLVEAETNDSKSKKQNKVTSQKEETPEPIQTEPTIEETRVPMVHDLPSTQLQENGVSTSQSNHIKLLGQRRQNRGRRSEQTSGTKISIHPSAIIVSPQHSPNVTANKSTNDELEWCSAGKKRASSRPAKESSTTSNTNSSSNRDIYHDLVILMNDNEQVADAWTITESNGKRRSFALNVNSGTVARIIGRAGQNINAIREATNAHIEVEKIATRREQSTRQITVKGSQDAIRTAIQMIDLLIRENDTHVNDIINRIVNDTSSNGSPVNLPSGTHAQTNDKNSRQTTNNSTVTSFTNSALSKAPATNVWQQKAAIRKLQQSTDEPRPPSSTLSSSNSESVSPVPISQVPHIATTVLAQHDYAYNVGHNEDLKRKAPGFERPSQSTHATPIKSAAEISTLFSTSENSSFNHPTSNAFLSSIFADNQRSEAINSFGDSAPLSHLIVGSHRYQSQQNNDNNNLSQQRSQRPLSEIWETNTPSQPQQSLGDFDSLFGSIDPKSAAALWLPPTSKADLKNNVSSRDDHWLDSSNSTSLFGMLGLGVDYGNGSLATTVSKPINTSGAASTNRPHSSTDWTNLSAAWSNNVPIETPLSAQRSSNNPLLSQNAHWSTPSAGADLSSPPKTTSTWSAAVPPTTPQSYRSSRPILPSTMSATQQTPIGQSPVSTWSTGNGKMDVFSLIAAQVGDVAEKEKRQQTQSQQVPSSSSINNVYAAYNAVPQVQRMQHNRITQNQTPPGISPFSSGVTWSGQPNVLNNNANSPASAFTPNKAFPLNQSVASQSGVHQTQQQAQWNGWNY